MHAEVPQIAVSSLVKTIKAHLEKAQQAQDRSEQHYISAGLHLAELKDRYKCDVKASKTQTWEQFVRDTFDLGRSRADELIRIADGRATLHDTRAVKAASVAKSKAKVPKTAASSGGSGDIAEKKARLAGKDADAPALALADLSERIAYAETAAIADDGNGRMTVTIGDEWREGLPKSANYTSATIEHLSQPTIPTKTVQAMVHNVPGAPGAVVFVEVPVAAILSTVLKDQFIAWLAADVGRNADPKGALSHEARQKAEAEVMGDLLAVERDEAALVWQAQAQGLPVEHRADCNPLAILQCVLRTVPRSDALPETSPGLSWPMRR
ncbi:hypothetical protein ACVWWO_007321 [Bradyrhizobium sp. F1.13.1]